MHPCTNLSEAGVLLLIQDIHSKRCGERSQSTTRSRICRSDKANDKQNTHDNREIVARCQERKDIVALEISHLAHTRLLCVGIEQEAQEEEQTNHHNLHDCTYNKVLLALARVLAGQSALHEVLVKTRSSNHQENTCEELLPEISTLLRIIKEESASHIATGPTLDIHTRTQNEIDTKCYG